MINQTRKLCKANLDKRIFINEVPNTLTYREFIREMERGYDYRNAMR